MDNQDDIHTLRHTLQYYPFNPLVRDVFQTTCDYYAQAKLPVRTIEKNLKDLYLHAVSLHDSGAIHLLAKVDGKLSLQKYVWEINAIAFSGWWPFPEVAADIKNSVLKLQAKARVDISDPDLQMQKCAAIFAAAICGSRVSDIEEVANNLLADHL